MVSTVQCSLPQSQNIAHDESEGVMAFRELQTLVDALVGELHVSDGVPDKSVLPEPHVWIASNSRNNIPLEDDVSVFSPPN